MPNRHVLFGAFFAAVVGLLSAPDSSHAGSGNSPEFGKPERVVPAPKWVSRPIPGRFIITLQPGANPSAVAAEHGVQPDFLYQIVLKGFAGRISDPALSTLTKDSRVVRIEQDREVILSQEAGSWGVDRIDQLKLPLDGKYKPADSGTRVYGHFGDDPVHFTAPLTGEGVRVYVIDTGIRYDHALFGDRAVPGIDMIGDGRNGNDCHGHGTHVAGIIGGSYLYGVADRTTLVSARVLNCQGSGSVSGVIYALDWVAANAQRPAVANLSLGGTASISLDAAVNGLVDTGIATVVAAGNESTDACTVSPARAPNALTVAATDRTDSRASFSNYGDCVDLFAPGVSIVSGYHSSSTALALMSGTSMAAPHVTGSVALLLESDPSLSASAVNSAVISSASTVMIGNAAGSPSRLVYAGTGTPLPWVTGE